MKDKSIGELHASVLSCLATTVRHVVGDDEADLVREAVMRARDANDEMSRRLREVVPLLDAVDRSGGLGHDNHAKLRQAIALVKGTAESAKCSSCNGRGLWGGDMTCPRCGGTGTAESATGGEGTE